MARARLAMALALALAAASLALLAPTAEAQGGLFINRLPIQPNANGYLLPFNETQRLTAGSFRRNVVALGATTTPQTIITINRCGILNPHFHPRGTEQLFIVSGSAEVVMFLEGTTAPDAPIRRVPLSQNQAVILPAGSVHYTRNTGRGPLVMIQTFDNPAPGTLFLSTVLAQLASSTPSTLAVLNNALPGLALRAGLTPKNALFLLPTNLC